jgi:RNA polymerase-binding transcription factor DksA
MQRRDIESTIVEARARAATREHELADALAGVVEASESANLDDEHDPEGSTVGFERAQLAALLDDARSRLADLDAAQERLERGAYGICEVCGQEISPARLEAQPAARRCVACAAPTGRPAPRR